MKWFSEVPQIHPSVVVTVLLSAVAGFVDSCTFLGLFGLFIAQLTGSYVMLGSLPIISGWPVATVVLAVPVFLFFGMLATLLAMVATANRFSAFAAVLLLETLLLVGFALVMILVPPVSQSSFGTFLAVSFGLAAMGVQSAFVRLLMPAVGSTNVMTTNTSQVAVDATQTIATWIRARSGDEELVQRYKTASWRFVRSVPLPLAFLAGTMVGAFGFIAIGAWALVLPIGVVGTLAFRASKVS